MSDVFVSYARSTATQAQAVAEALRLAPQLPAHDILVVNLSGRGDKDMGILARELKLQGA